MNGSDILLNGIQAIERLESEKAELSVNIGDHLTVLKGHGFDKAVVKAVIKRRKMTADQRAEADALLELYEASIGGLDGRSLGDAARARLEKDKGADAGPVDERLAPDSLSADDLKAAREEGKAAQADGNKVTDNPYVFGDPRRAAWDEGWCMASGSDGMDIPDAFKASPKEKKGDAPSDAQKPETPGEAKPVLSTKASEAATPSKRRKPAAPKGAQSLPKKATKPNAGASDALKRAAARSKQAGSGKGRKPKSDDGAGASA